MLLVAAMVGLGSVPAVRATDYFLTIAGGYEPEGNQASLEANVVFFQQILAERSTVARRHDVYFADGLDPMADLQIEIEKPAKSTTPATDLLSALHRRRGEVDVAYRNHAVKNVAGPLDPKLIQLQLETVARNARDGDRLIVYVTAHGSEGPKEDPYNTTIDCWNEHTISAREFSGWLDKLPPTVPVMMVMAQCYCGGFGHTIFRDLDPGKGLASPLRAGFFAQQHNLPAAGCRPDIEHDEEFSSYFWGAIAGRSRNGVPIKDADVDGNGVVSFDEGYAHAVTAGETIDIPLRSSEVLLRKYSRLTEKPPAAASESTANTEDAEKPAAEVAPRRPLVTLTGTLQSIVERGGSVNGRIVRRLSETLGFKLDDDVSVVMKAFEEHRRDARAQGRRGRRQSSGRRELLREVAAKWPELGDERHWRESSLLKAENQDKLLSDLQQLPSWKTYEERLQQRATAGKEAERHELRGVKFRRLLNALESIILERNLSALAPPEVVARYQQILTLEQSSLSKSPF